MKKKLIALALLIAGLSSCNSDEKLTGNNPSFLAEDESLITVTIKNVGAPVGYADDAAYGELAATAEEKEIKNVAFFAKFESTDILQTFFSKEELDSDHGFMEALAATGVEGEYTAKFKITNEDGKEGETQKVDFVAIANYDENTTDLNLITTEAQLNEFLANELADNPTTPLVMYGTYQADVEPGVPVVAEFKMKRTVARVDVVNEAGTDLVLTSAKVLNAKKTSFLLPSLDETAVNNLEVLDYPTAIAPEAATPAKIEGLYMYENLNADAATATAIEIKGTYKGTPLLKRIEFTKMNEEGVDTVVPILRNNLYLVRLYPSSDENEVNFTLQVADWSIATDTFILEPTQYAPEFKLIAEESDMALTTVDADKQIYSCDISDIANAQGKKIVFYASGYQDSNAEIEYVGTTKCTGNTWMNTAIEQGELVGGYATEAPTNIAYRKYTITIPTLDPATATTPSDAIVKIYNIYKKTKFITIRIKYRPNYENVANAKPVLFKGQFWAPINVGATATGLGIDAAHTGKYYQWGRNVAFDYPTSTPTDVQAGPVTYVQATTGEYSSKFITNGTDPYDWLIVEDASFETRNNLWSAAVNDSPCPEGWRVPTKAELDEIRKAYVKENFAANLGLTVPADEDGNPLLLPAAGNRGNGSGAGIGQGINGFYWSAVPAGKRTPRLFFNNSSTDVGSYYRAIGYSVRCVQE